jgi:hypothetical protein
MDGDVNRVDGWKIFKSIIFNGGVKWVTIQRTI